MTIPPKVVRAQPTSKKISSLVDLYAEKSRGEEETLFNSNITVNIFRPPLSGL